MLPRKNKPIPWCIMKIIWLLVYFGVLIWSAINPKDYFTWFLVVFPALIGLAVIAATYKRFRLTPLAYFLILAHSIILMVGGHTHMPKCHFLTGYGKHLT